MSFCKHYQGRSKRPGFRGLSSPIKLVSSAYLQWSLMRAGQTDACACCFFMHFTSRWANDNCEIVKLIRDKSSRGVYSGTLPGSLVTMTIVARGR